MEALVIYETMFGNTRRIAEAIGTGLAGHGGVVVANVVDAPQEVPPQVDLLVLGGPTHAFSMSREATRKDAVQRGADPDAATRGIREWLEGLTEGGHRQAFAAFDTRVDMPLVAGAASRKASKAARKLGFTVLDHESFLVEGYEGPIVDGELDRARTWATTLVRRVPAA
jgi:hypothetical protein